jgi:Tol biopolymer transport system component
VYRTLVIIVAASLVHIAAKSDEPEKKIPEGRLLVGDETKLLLLTPDGKTLGVISGLPEKCYLRDQAISPDGKRVAFIVDEFPPKNRRGEILRYILIRDIEGKSNETKLDVKAQNMAWTTDGKLLVVEIESNKDLKDRKFITWLVDVATKNKTRLDLPESAQAFALTPDGKTFIASTKGATEKKLHLSLISRDVNKITHLTEIDEESSAFRLPKLSPDGSRILFYDDDREEKLEIGKARLYRLFVYNLKTQKRERIEGQPQNGLIQSYAWSPDSKRLVYSWERFELDMSLPADGKLKLVDKDTEWQVTVADANGKNAKAVLSAKVPATTNLRLKTKTGETLPVGDSVIVNYYVDWR